ncbi:MAG: DUF2125 domain-containing protein [Paracoccaceae bacterium]
MKHWKSISTLAVLAGTVSANGAAADITAQDVWDDMRSVGENYGQTISGNPSMSGDTMTVSDLKIAVDTPEGTLSGTMCDIALKELGDGTVEIVLPADFPLSITMDPAQGETVSADMMLHQSGLTTIVSGSPGDSAYDSTSDNVSFEVTKLVVDGKPVDLSLTVALASLAANYAVTGGDLRDIASTMTADKATVDFALTAPDGSGDASGRVEMADLKSASKSAVPADMQMNDMANMLKEGFAMNANFSHGATSYTLDVNDKGGTTHAEGSADDGSIGIRMDGKTMSYGAEQTGTSLTMSGSSIPLPELTAQIAETAFKFTMPVAKSDDALDFGLLTRLKGVKVSDQLWGMFDPMGALPHDPANLVIDLSGKGRWLVDIMDPQATQNLDSPPGELQSLDINDLELTIAGASLTGDGAFTFDNTDLTTFDGMPAPTGTANLKLVGANTLMDKLVEMGLLPQDQAQGARMMLGLFARPGDGADTLVSEISVTEDGQVLANGQRLK